MTAETSTDSQPSRDHAAASDGPGRLLATLPVSRVAAILRGLLCLAGAVTLWVITWAIYRGLLSGGTNIIVNASIALVALPAPIGALVLTVKGIRWSVLGLWPAPVAFAAHDNRFMLRLGPFGTRQLDADRIDVRYPFEWETEDGGFEQFLPEEEQKTTLLPRVTHPDVTEPINRLLVRFVAMDERIITQTMRPAFDHWRGENFTEDTP